jgi:putative transcriptional regulator
MTRLHLLLLALVLSVLPPPSLRAALPKSDPVPDGGSLAGQLLIAAPDMGDPRFTHAVILMVHHDKEGAFGIMLNRLLGEHPIAEILGALGDEDAGIDGSIRIFLGGPVQPEMGFVVHSTDYRRPDSLEIDGHVAVTQNREILRDIGRHKGPAKFIVAFGYAGWGPGQLENEIAQHGWFITAEDPHLTFDEDRARVWETALARRSRDL